MKSNLDNAIECFLESGYKILEIWDEDMDSLENYPFDKSFDDVMAEMHNWLINTTSDESIEYKYLDKLSDAYDAITRKFEDYHDTKDMDLLADVRNLEDTLEEQLRYLKFAQDRNGNIYPASKDRQSISTIIVDGKSFSYYNFFKGYKPFGIK